MWRKLSTLRKISTLMHILRFTAKWFSLISSNNRRLSSKERPVAEKSDRWRANQIWKNGEWILDICKNMSRIKFIQVTIFPACVSVSLFWSSSAVWWLKKWLLQLWRGRTKSNKYFPFRRTRSADYFDSRFLEGNTADIPKTLNSHHNNLDDE